MFSKNTYHLLPPQVAPSLHPLPPPPPPPFLGINNGAEILLHCQNSMLYNHPLAANTAPLYPAATATMFDGDLSVVPNAFPRRQMVKKDRHSKILTAQGPRDRRVRLSIGVARKFFDLQEMLGFDKPSKTLDWLMAKSKAAIKDLAQSKSVSSASEVENGVENGTFSSGADSKGKSVNPAKEARVKARARARERTREKMCIKQFNQAKRPGSSTGLDSNLNPSNTSIQHINNLHEACKTSGSKRNCTGDLIYEAATSGDLIRGPIVIRNIVTGFQQNLINSRDLSKNYGVPSPGATENWEIGSFASQSSISTILDQHKFINISTSSI